MSEKILILDFGSQYTQLIARRIRELNVFCEIFPYNHFPRPDQTVKGIILSGSPFSVADPEAPQIDLSGMLGKWPVLGICYGAQYMAATQGGKVEPSARREYGRARLTGIQANHPLLKNIPEGSQVWMSHADSIMQLPENAAVIATTESIPVAAFELDTGNRIGAYGLQFHPEVSHSTDGKTLLGNYVHGCCGCRDEWTPESFVTSTINQLKEQLGEDHVVMGISGGVDSSVAAELLHRAIGERLHGIFVDNGLLRKNEFREVLTAYRQMGINLKGVDARKEFYDNLRGIEEPEHKRKIIGKTFIDVFEREARAIDKALGANHIKWLGQGTIYPDVIESVSVHGPSATIKSHHNVGGLPDKLNLKVIEPLRMLFKDEVRKVGASLNIPENILNRHPFPGPGLGIRILGPITEERVRILQEADAIFIDSLWKSGLYHEVWQAGTILTPVRSVGVMGDERTYENVIALRAVTSTDGMTADWAKLPYDFLAEVSTRIINEVQGVNRVVYDISTKPPATIEWE